MYRASLCIFQPGDFTRWGYSEGVKVKTGIYSYNYLVCVLRISLTGLELVNLSHLFSTANNILSKVTSLHPHVPVYPKDVIFMMSCIVEINLFVGPCSE